MAKKVKNGETTPPAVSEQMNGAQMLQERINSGNMYGTPGTQIPTKTDQEKFFDAMQNRYGVNNGNQGAAPTVAEVPTVAKVTDPTATGQKNVYLYDWASGMSMADAYKQGKHNRGDIMRDRERWGRENNSPVNVLEAMDMVPENHDPRKTYQENELEEKRRKREENWEKIGNFLSHLGNFVGAAGWGGSVQGLEHPKELTARQQALRDKTDALRSAYNKSYFENYYKQRADENNQQKLKLSQQNQDRLERQYDLMVRKQDWKEKYDAGILDSKKEALRLKEDYNNKIISLREYEDGIKMINALANKQRANTSNYNAHNPKDYVVEKEENTPFGKKKTTTRKTYGAKPKEKEKKSAFR